MTRTAIIDNDLCNLDSIARAIEECDGNPFVTTDPDSLGDAGKIILPGVGAFGDAMKNLRANGMADALTKRVKENGVLFLGVCLGMQLIALDSEESPGVPGLGWINAHAIELAPTMADERVPHVGWNEVTATGANPLLEGISPGTDFYFVHSYHVDCADSELVAGTTPYCGQFASVIAQGNIMGAQFHPEKSQKAGFQLLRNFLAL